MAASIPSDSPLIALLRKYAPSSLPSSPSASSNDYSAAEISQSLFSKIDLNEAERGEQYMWITSSLHIDPQAEDQAKTTERLAHLNTHLASRTTILGSKPSLADVAAYSKLAPLVSSWSRDERTGEKGYHHIVRHTAFVQGSPLFGLSIPDADKVQIDLDDVAVPIKPIDAKAEKEKKKKRDKEAAAAAAAAPPNSTPSTATDAAAAAATDAAAAAATAEVAETATEAAKDDVGAPSTQVEAGRKAKKAAGGAAPEQSGADKAPKKEKQKKAPPPPKEQPKPLSPALIDLRVGHILKAIPHPNADSLYVSTIACGDAPGTENTSEYEGQVVRTVCSGLNGLIPLEEMQDRKIIAVCNLKPVTMRGVKSAAMVLAASPRMPKGQSDPHKDPVELVTPPSASKAGDRVCFEGWEGEPEPVLNPKKKIWEMCQVGFTTLDDCTVAFDAGAVTQLEGKTGVASLKTGGQACTVKTLKGATVN